MISIYNGRSRHLGEGDKKDVYIQMSVAMREHLHLFKGAMLAVFLAISLHADEDGISWPSVALLCKGVLS